MAARSRRGAPAGGAGPLQPVTGRTAGPPAGRLTDAALCALEDGACPGAGACGGQFTANTMATAIEFLGIAPMGSGAVPAVDPATAAPGRSAGRLVMDLVRKNLTPREILTRKAIENAIAAVLTTGGSTNAVLH